MSAGRHSYIAFYPSDWKGGTAQMTRTHRSVYFDICLYIWDYAKPCPEKALPLMLGDVEDWRRYVDDLVAAEKLHRTPDGSLYATKALAEAKKAFDLWEKKSKGGKSAAKKTNEDNGGKSDDSNPDESPDESPDAEPEPDVKKPEDKSSVKKKSAEPETQPDPTGLPGENPDHAGQPPPENPEKPPETATNPPKTGLTAKAQAPPKSAENPGKPPVDRSGNDIVQAVAAWNALAAETGLPTVTKLTDDRRGKLKARLQDCGGLDGWIAALEKIRASPGLLGRTGGSWRANFDFVLRESGFVKIMEGNYDGWVETNRRGGESGSVVEAGRRAVETLRNRDPGGIRY